MTITGTTDAIFKAFNLICKKLEEVRLVLFFFFLNTFLVVYFCPSLSLFAPIPSLYRRGTKMDGQVGASLQDLFENE